MDTRSVVRDLYEQSTAVAGIFDPGSDAALQAAVRVVEQRCDFDFTKLAGPLKKGSGSPTMKVVFRSLSSDTSAQVDPGARPVVIEVNSDMRDASPDDIALRILAETAHVVDMYLLTPEARRAIYLAFGGDNGRAPDDPWFSSDDLPHVPRSKRYHKLTHKMTPDGYWTQVGESFMGGFLYAFGDWKTLPRELTTKFAHAPTPAIGRLIRRLLTAT